MKKLIASAFILSAAFAFAESVTGVTAKQRWPWNNLVDIDFTLAGAGKQGEVYQIEVEAQGASGGTVYTAKTFLTEPIARPGTGRVTWDFGKDYPNVKASDMVFTVSATTLDSTTPVYLVVDLSGGAKAKSYPVRYTTSAPVCTPGQNDPCKTTELWFKYVRAGTFTAGYGNGGNNWYPEHTCILTNDYYLGVFSLTKAQYANIGQNYTTYFQYFTNETCKATRPCDAISSNVLRGEIAANATPVGNTVIGRLRSRTGLKFDLPTEWQWEYAARAGNAAYDTTQIRNSSTVSTSGVNKNSTEEVGTSYVDRYPANAWGFYGMLGNVWEWCLNTRTTVTKGSTLTEPLPNPTSVSRNRSNKGGGWASGGTVSAPYAARTSADQWNFSNNTSDYGARICLVIK